MNNKITRSNLDIIKSAIVSNNVIRINYRKATKEFKKPKPYGHKDYGDLVRRNIEPYDIREEVNKDGVSKNYLWAVDITTMRSDDNHIKKFILNGIQGATKLNRTFTPRSWT